jgi:hypothetical protein
MWDPREVHTFFAQREARAVHGGTAEAAAVRAGQSPLNPPAFLLETENRRKTMGIKVIVGGVVAAVAVIAGIAALGGTVDDYKEECGKGMHKKITDLYDNGAAKVRNIRMLDVWDDKVVEPTRAEKDRVGEGKFKLMCEAKATFSNNSDRIIRYYIYEARGQGWTVMHLAGPLNGKDS